MGKASRVKTRARPRVGPHTRVERVSERSCPGTPRVNVEGSDKKQRGPVPGICALCRSDTSLRLSHIIPRWAYQWMREDGGHIHRPIGRAGVVTHIQDGEKHYLLCGPCEQYLGAAENYLRLICAGRADELKSQDVSICHHPHCAMHVTSNQEHLISRALLGIVLKEHHAPSSDIYLRSDNVVENLRLSILADDYSAYGGCVAFKWMGREPVNPRNAAGSSSALIHDGTVSVIITVGGVEWWLFPKGRSKLMGGPSPLNVAWTIILTDNSLREAGKLHWSGMECNAPDPWSDVAATDACPCGNDQQFEKCCRHSWCSWPDQRGMRPHNGGAGRCVTSGDQ